MADHLVNSLQYQFPDETEYDFIPDKCYDCPFINGQLERILEVKIRKEIEDKSLETESSHYLTEIYDDSLAQVITLVHDCSGITFLDTDSGEIYTADQRKRRRRRLDRELLRLTCQSLVLSAGKLSPVQKPNL